MDTIGGRIKTLRKKANLTQQGLVDALKSMGADVTRVSVSRWEHNVFAPQAWPTKCMADLFEVSMDYLMDGITPVSNSIKPDERAIIEAVRINPSLARLIDCARKLTSAQIEIACKIVCSLVDNQAEKIS